MKKLFTLIALVAVGSFGLVPANSVGAAAFPDTAGHRNEEAIDYLENQGVVEGYADGNFGPNSKINRAEFLKILMESTQTSLQGVHNCFPDVQKTWYSDYVCSAEKMGIIDGYPDGYFRPNNNINLVEALKIVLETYEADVDYNYDVWYEPYLFFANDNYLLNGLSSYLDDEIFRADMAQLIYNLDIFYEIYKPTPNLPIGLQPDPDKPMNCYISDELMNYQFTNPDLVSEDYPLLIEEVDTKAQCRDYVIEKYGLKETVRKSLQVGDTIDLANNISVKIVGIEIERDSSEDVVKIDIQHYVNGKKLSTVPRRHTLYYGGDENWNEDFGYRIELVSLDDNNDFEVEFTPLTPHINNPEDLYNDCYFLSESTINCYAYSLFEPLTGQIKMETENFIIIGPEKGREYFEGMGSQFEICFDDAKNYLGVDGPDEKTIIHFVPQTGSYTAVASFLGVRWFYNDVKRNTYEGVNHCTNNSIAHELVHILVRNAKLSDILDEGLATYVSHQIINNSGFSCEEDGFYLDEELNDFGYLNLYGQIPYNEGGSDLYETAACFWEEYEKDFGKDLFLDTMDFFVDNAVLESVSGSTLDLLEEEFGFDLADYRTKYGFDYTDEGYFYEKIGEEYYVGLIGHTLFHWDGNYGN